MSRAFRRTAEPDVWLLLDPRGRVLRSGGPGMSDLEVAVPDAGAEVLARIHPDDWDAATQAFVRARHRPGSPVPVALRVLAESGRWHDLALEITDRTHDARYGGIVVSGCDVTGRRLAEIASRLESTLLDSLPTAVIVTDDDGVCVYWNRAATAIYGYERDDVLGRAITSVNVGPSGTDVAEEIMRSVRDEGRWEGDYDARRADGSVVPIHTTLITVEDAEIGFRGIAGASMDISDRRRLEQDVAFRLLHDDLTGLPNGRFFGEQAEAAASSAGGAAGIVAVVLLDLDGFREVNEVHDAFVGDQVLRCVGDRLQGLGHGAWARISGDEFAVCVRHLDTEADAVRIAEQVRERLVPPVALRGHALRVRASIGVATATSPMPAGVLVRRAHQAMCDAKARGGDRCCAFDAAAAVPLPGTDPMPSKLRRALAAGEVRTAFQPVVDMRSGDIVGFEALARWTSPEGPVEPSEFIPVAEAAGLIDDIGAVVLDDACRLLAALRTVAPERPLTVSVNVSPGQLLDPSLPCRVASVLDAHGVPPGRLCLEVTEGGLVDSVDAVALLRDLKAAGVRVAIDDFGTGFSSLSRLCTFPLDHLKIDKSFVQGLLERAEYSVVVASVINLADTLGIATVAEGVELPDQLRELLQLGCSIGQGVHWSPAVPHDEAVALVVGGPLQHDADTPRRQLNLHRSVVEPSVDDAVALLAHELAQPAQVIAGFAELLKRHPPEDVQRHGIAAIGRAMRRTSSVLDLVRDARALDTGTLRLQRSQVGLDTVVSAALEGLDVAESTAVELPEVVVDVDVDRVAAAVTNLVVNAHRHTPIGTAVAVVGEVGPTSVTVHVLDDGPGIAAEDVGLVFKRFGRADTSSPGTGLGLYVARGIARAHGGELAYRPRRSGGSDFFIELPLQHPSG